MTPVGYQLSAAGLQNIFQITTADVKYFLDWFSNIFCHNIEQIDVKIDKGSNMSNQTSLISVLSVCILLYTILLTDSDRNRNFSFQFEIFRT